MRVDKGLPLVKRCYLIMCSYLIWPCLLRTSMKAITLNS